MKIIEWFDGKKTIIGALASLTIGFLGIKDIIDQETATYLLGVAGLIIGVGVAHKKAKEEI